MQAKKFEFKTKHMFVQIASKSNFLAIILFRIWQRDVLFQKG
eukprot:UN05151